MADYEVVTPRPVRKLIDALAGKRAGYQRVQAQLRRDPCAPELGAYRLAGPLEPIVCGVHLDRGYRLAFAMQPPETVGQPTRCHSVRRPREPDHRQSDIWTILHDLFGVQNPPTDHDRPPCCQGSMPDIEEGELDACLRDLKQLTRGRVSSRRRRGST